MLKYPEGVEGKAEIPGDGGELPLGTLPLLQLLLGTKIFEIYRWNPDNKNNQKPPKYYFIHKTCGDSHLYYKER